VAVFQAIRRVYVLLALGLLAAIAGLVAVTVLRATRTIEGLLTENRKLQSALATLTRETQIGYAQALAQRTDAAGRLFTTVRFVETDPADPRKTILEKQCELEGDILHFDALIVRFDSRLVMDGAERALYLWRRVYGEQTRPADGVPIEAAGAEPIRYKALFERLSLKDRRLFWSEIWNLADDPDRLKALGVRAVFGNAVYTRLKPGVTLYFKIDAMGGVFPEAVPNTMQEAPAPGA